jgi:glycosyltransferase involved in cell wall biosynthesis
LIMADPEVTVIVPALNAAATIDTTIHSVIRESRAVSNPVEILVIDGGSFDGTLRCVSRHHQVGILRQTSRGLGAARNEAVSKTKAPLVAFCDADDVWAEGSLSKRLEILTASPDTWAVSGRVRFERIKGYSGGLPIRRSNGDEHKGYTPGAMLVRRHALQAIPFDEGLSIAADTDWLIRALSTFGDMAHIDETVLIKGLRAGSLSTDVDSYRKELMISVRRHLHSLESNQQ